MTPKRLVLATSVLALVAISGPALAGTIMSDQRPHQARLVGTHEVRQPENAFASEMPAQPIEQHRYHGGPKQDY